MTFSSTTNNMAVMVNIEKANNICIPFYVPLQFLATILQNAMIMAPVAMMGNVYAMITIMELTAQVNQFCYFIVNSFKNIIQILKLK